VKRERQTDRRLLRPARLVRPMSETVVTTPSSPHGTAWPRGPLSIPFVIAAALLIGLGIFLISLWMETFSWAYFGGIGLLAIGGLMLFSPRAGADRAP
jgi:hypothetical protein